MLTIYKYFIPLTELSRLDLPSDYKILKFGNQKEQPALWVEVDTDLPPVPVLFRLVGTGHEIPPGYEHVGSDLFQNGTYVWHLYRYTGPLS